MHHSTTGRRSRTHRWALLTLLCALALLGAAQLAPAALAAKATFTGGPDTGDFPLYVPNDHTVSAVTLLCERPDGRAHVLREGPFHGRHIAGQHDESWLHLEPGRQRRSRRLGARTDRPVVQLPNRAR